MIAPHTNYLVTIRPLGPAEAVGRILRTDAATESFSGQF
jgi:hypothetical protein